MRGTLGGTMRSFAVVLCLAAALLAPRPCSAQVAGTVELTPLAGAYLPSAAFPPQPYVCPRGTPCNYYETLSREQRSATAIGGRVTGWVRRGIAVEGGLWYSPSSVTWST